MWRSNLYWRATADLSDNFYLVPNTECNRRPQAKVSLRLYFRYLGLDVHSGSDPKSKVLGCEIY